MSLASAAAVGPNMDRRPIAIMGDGGFWHNGLITGVASTMFNKGDGVLIVMQNGYASATGQQYLPSSAANRIGGPTGMTIEQTLRSLGVKWLRTVRSYSVTKMTKTLKEAMRTAERGLKVIIAGAGMSAALPGVAVRDVKPGDLVVSVVLEARHAGERGVERGPHHLAPVGQGAGLLDPLSLQVICATQAFGPCPPQPGMSYPRPTNVQMLPLPPQRSMPFPCSGVPHTPWCKKPHGAG